MLRPRGIPTKPNAAVSAILSSLLKLTHIIISKFVISFNNRWPRHSPCAPVLFTLASGPTLSDSPSRCTRRNEIGDLLLYPLLKTAFYFAISHFLIMIKHCLTLSKSHKIATKPKMNSQKLYVIFSSVLIAFAELSWLFCFHAAVSFEIFHSNRNEFSQVLLIAFRTAMATVNGTSFTMA